MLMPHNTGAELLRAILIGHPHRGQKLAQPALEEVLRSPPRRRETSLCGSSLPTTQRCNSSRSGSPSTRWKALATTATTCFSTIADPRSGSLNACSRDRQPDH